MTRKFLVIICTIIIVFIGMFNFNTVYAGDISDVFTGGDDFMAAADGDTNIDEDKLEEASDMIYTILLVLGMGIAVIVSAILGIKFMMGSVEEKAKVQEQLIPFVVGCVVIFGAFSIWKIGVNVGENLNTHSYCYVCGKEFVYSGEVKMKKCDDCVLANGSVRYCYICGTKLTGSGEVKTCPNDECDSKK